MKSKAKKTQKTKAAASKPKLKDKLKKVLSLSAVSRKSVLKRPGRAAGRPTAAQGQEIPLQDMKVEQAKFYTGTVEQPVYQKSVVAELEHKELAWRYGEDILVLQIRDPWWAHAYWDVSANTLERLSKELGHSFGAGSWHLRSYDVSFINFTGTNAHRFFDTSVDVDAGNWYLNFGSPGTSWCVDLGLLLPDGRFITVLRSNTVSLPLDGPSWVTDEEWMIPEDEFRRLYGMSVGLGPNVSSPVGKLWQERLKRDVSSRGIASMGVSSPVKKGQVKLPFWLVVDCELIVYGATEPDAHVTVQGKPIKLRKDGTFTLRFALPDGRQDIPVVAKSAKIDETRTITPVVTRKTTRNP
ncbi:MAG: DUF4912 domain-containing protein [Candidatus Omnitrophica bacterium]|nr:DUF4912 domain-containing protein [Candidatus Omnitrophota bacterium]MDD5137535.1 DUF4912 domain-containing protein [Candidatus Omnitrophota bacterium]